MIPGWIFPLLILLPNLLFLFFPPTGRPVQIEKKKPILSVIMEIVERIGQVTSFVIPVFFSAEISDSWSLFNLMILVSALIFYYAGWIRYFRNGRKYISLFEPMLTVPIPMAVAPVVFLNAAAALLQSQLLFLAVVLLAIGHIYVSYQEWKSLGKK